MNKLFLGVLSFFVLSLSSLIEAYKLDIKNSTTDTINVFAGELKEFNRISYTKAYLGESIQPGQSKSFDINPPSASIRRSDNNAILVINGSHDYNIFVDRDKTTHEPALLFYRSGSFGSQFSAVSKIENDSAKLSISEDNDGKLYID